MTRLPIPGSDDGSWGDVLNQYLSVSLNADGTLKPSAVSLAGGGGTYSAAYGQLNVTSQGIDIWTENDWQAIPFNATGPASNVGVSTTAPATVTIQHAGVYNISCNLYFAAEDADEGIFLPTSYMLGVSVNGGSTAPVAAVYARYAGSFSLNYGSIIECAANDTLQFYMTASSADPPPFANILTIESGNAFVMQIAGS